MTTTKTMVQSNNKTTKTALKGTNVTLGTSVELQRINKAGEVTTYTEVVNPFTYADTATKKRFTAFCGHLLAVCRNMQVTDLQLADSAKGYVSKNYKYVPKSKSALVVEPSEFKLTEGTMSINKFVEALNYNAKEFGFTPKFRKADVRELKNFALKREVSNREKSVTYNATEEIIDAVPTAFKNAVVTVALAAQNGDKYIKL